MITPNAALGAALAIPGSSHGLTPASHGDGLAISDSSLGLLVSAITGSRSRSSALAFPSWEHRRGLPTTRPMLDIDIEYLAPRLRDIDVEEIARLFEDAGASPEGALKTGLEHSHDPRTIIGVSGAPIGAFGCIPISEEGAYVWMLATPDLELPANARSFLRWSKAWIDFMSERYPILRNFVLRKNAASIRWLGWLGFDFLDTPNPEVLMFRRYGDKT